MKKTNRIFIIAPTDIGEAEGDTLHIVCKTKSHDSFFNIYQGDTYEEIDRTGGLKSAIKIAKKHGAKKPYILS